MQNILMFTDDDLKRLKSLANPNDNETDYQFYAALLAKLEAAELIREYAGAPQHENWRKADEAWRKAVGK